MSRSVGRIVWVGVALTLIVTVTFAVLALRPSAPQQPLEIGPETTVLEGPVREDGTVDYAAALNARRREGVTPESNVSW